MKIGDGSIDTAITVLGAFKCAINKTGQINVREENEKEINGYIDMAIDALKKQPKIGGWIPIEEKLPPDGQKVLLTCNYMMFDYVTVGTMENGNRGKSYIADEDTFMRSAILAWQPLPNTYRK